MKNDWWAYKMFMEYHNSDGVVDDLPHYTSEEWHNILDSISPTDKEGHDIMSPKQILKRIDFGMGE